MKLKDEVRVKGRCRLTIRDAETGEILEQMPWRNNLVTDDGEELYAKLMKGDALDPCGYCAVGSGFTPAAEGDSAMEAEIGRLVVTNISITGSAVTYDTFFGAADCNGTWWEIGMLTLAVGGVLVARTVLGASKTKNATKTVTVSYELSVT
jgi:hypothetical protein